MNKIIIIGNVCHDPECRSTQSGKTVCSFDVAVNRRVNGENNPEYMRVTAWNKLAETCAKYITKGRKVAITGEASASAWLGRDEAAHARIEVLAQDVEFLSPREQGEGNQFRDQRMAQTERDQRETAAQYGDGFTELTDDSNLPF